MDTHYLTHGVMHMTGEESLESFSNKNENKKR